jgi:hypothetical protein
MMAGKKPTKGKKTQIKKQPKVVEQLPSVVPNKATNDMTPAEQASINQMIQLAKLEYMKTLKNNIVNEKRREIDTLDMQIKEFLGPYMLIGYDLNNQPVEIVSAEDPASHDALLERFRRVMFKINNNIVQTQGNDPYGFKDRPQNDSDED